MRRQSIAFTKMVGAGNDFVVVNAEDLNSSNLSSLSQKICNRTNGIGADGVIVLDKSLKSDYKMRIINSDGSEAEMCGNGVRCLVAYIKENKNPEKKLFSIETLGGEILSETEGTLVNVRLRDPQDYRSEIALDLNNHQVRVQHIDTGVPHVIVFVEDLEMINIKEEGKVIRYHDAFAPQGVNVNFVQIHNDSYVQVRTYERGVEGETKACGTGSVAAGLMGYLQCHKGLENKKEAKMNVGTQGGEVLEVTFDIVDGIFSNVWLKGSANFIAKGEWYV